MQFGNALKFMLFFSLFEKTANSQNQDTINSNFKYDIQANSNIRFQEQDLNI